MDEEFEELVVSVRAETSGFAQDVARMKSEFDSTLLPGLDSAGKVLERSLTAALRDGKLGFEDLKRTALSVLDEIAGKSMTAGLGQLFSGLGGQGGIGSLLSGLFGLPGRATGGLVSPDRPYLVGERGPELFVPDGAGRVEAAAAIGAARNDVRVSINLAQPRGASAPTALQRSSRQVASAVRRALAN
ncbi:tail tape measure protein [Qipengyuania xiapuensis]|uniref:Tail tape measure protein n=1 Tax=Qipengyuania xiapuensis TaxID=2867236 RepID=A0ABX8ZRS8_9SPHN|nr:tail tape measure protein [Qipengyuania xiapuensis]QZD91733.1 tail tape measure protein [Qipengyuania xiapuensis]